MATKYPVNQWIDWRPSEGRTYPDFEGDPMIQVKFGFDGTKRISL